MKNLKYLLPALFIVIGLNTTMAQDKANHAEAIKKMADSKMLVFSAQKASVSAGAAAESGLAKNITAGGSNRVTLDDSFKLVVKADSVISFLPYFDINEHSTTDVTDNYGHVTVNTAGTRYATVNYKYTVKQRKKGDVQIKIDPTGDSPIEQFLLEIDPSGTAELTLSIKDHATIVYDGIIVF